MNNLQKKKQAPQAPLLFWRITKELHILVILQICIYFHINKATSIQINIQLFIKYTSIKLFVVKFGQVRFSDVQVDFCS